MRTARGGGAGSARGLPALSLLLAAVGCADTVRPVLGGLKIGVQGGAFSMPVMLNERTPFEYPPDAWRARVGGETVLKLYISAGGTVDSVFVLRSAGHQSLDSAALANARRLRYQPARQGEDPVAVWATLPIRYPLPEEISPDEP